jgi:hypothetical protein
VNYVNYSQCVASLNERLTAATQRAEAAEARRDVWEKRAVKVVQERRALRVECDALRELAKTECEALRTRLDEWVRWGDRMASGHPDAPLASLDHEVRAVIANRYGMSTITAAMAVQPTTGETHDYN